MAATREGAALTEVHRQSQAHIGARVASRMMDVSGLLDLSDFDASFASWLRTTKQIVNQGKTDSALASASYFTRFRDFEIGDIDTFSVNALKSAPARQIEAVMHVEVLARVRRQATSEIAVRRAFQTALTESARSAQRLALDGGRDTLQNAIRTDQRALGHARATSGSPCHFCAMLASRGPVYGDDSFARSNARFSGSGRMKVHNGCHCTSEPVFHRDADWPTGAKKFADKWQEISSQAENPTEARLLFRQSIENR